MYTDEQWDNILAFLNDEAEKPEPEGIGKPIELVTEFIDMLRRTEAIKPSIVNTNAAHAREFARLQSDKRANAQAAIDIQDQIDNHPGNSNPPGRP